MSEISRLVKERKKKRKKKNIKEYSLGFLVVVVILSLYITYDINKPKEVKKEVKKEVVKEKTTKLSSDYRYCSTHNIQYLPSKMTDAYGETKILGCTKCIEKDFNESLKKGKRFSY